MVKGYDGDTLWFNITEDEAEDTFKKDGPPKEREYSRYKSASVTEQYDNVSLSNTTITEVSQTNGYNIEERLPLLEKKDTIKNTTTGTGDSAVGKRQIIRRNKAVKAYHPSQPVSLWMLF